MIINTDQIKELLNSNVPAYAISQNIGVTNSVVDNLMKNRSDLDEAKLKTLKKLQEYYNENGAKKMETLKITGLKKAVGEFNKWQGSARIYYDKDSDSVECYTYTSPGSFEEFKDKNAVEVLQKATRNMQERDDTTNMAELSELCKNA